MKGAKDISKKLLGKIIVRKILKARIVETECYIGNIDYAEEAKDFLWRFYIEGSSYLSMN